MEESYRTGPETPRLIHRTLTLDDAEAFYELNSNPDVMRYTGEPPLPSLQASKDAIVNYPDFDTIGYGRWACVLKETQTLIGFCGLKYLSDLDLVDVGYRFLPGYWGRGLATEACAASVQFGLETLGLPEIFGFVLPENTGSIRVLEKVGMHRDGEMTYDGIRTLRFLIRRETS